MFLLDWSSESAMSWVRRARRKEDGRELGTPNDGRELMAWGRFCSLLLQRVYPFSSFLNIQMGGFSVWDFSVVVPRRFIRAWVSASSLTGCTIRQG